MYDGTYYMLDALKQNIKDKINIWLSEPTNGAKYFVEGNNIVDFSGNG